MQNRIIVPAKFNTEIVILLDSVSGQTELKVKQGNINMLALVGILMEHATGLLRQMMSNAKPIKTEIKTESEITNAS